MNFILPILITMLSIVILAILLLFKLPFFRLFIPQKVATRNKVGALFSLAWSLSLVSFVVTTMDMNKVVVGGMIFGCLITTSILVWAYQDQVAHSYNASQRQKFIYIYIQGVLWLLIVILTPIIRRSVSQTIDDVITGFGIVTFPLMIAGMIWIKWKFNLFEKDATDIY